MSISDFFYILYTWSLGVKYTISIYSLVCCSQNMRQRFTLHGS